MCSSWQTELQKLSVITGRGYTGILKAEGNTCTASRREASEKAMQSNWQRGLV